MRLSQPFTSVLPVLVIITGLSVSQVGLTAPYNQTSQQMPNVREMQPTQPNTGSPSQTPANESMDKPLNHEELKESIIELNAEFKNLEESLLYPAASQVGIYLSTNVGQFFQIENVEVRLNQQPLVGFLYTPEQRAALEKGGIHGIETMNLPAGEHELVVTLIGQDQAGESLKRGITHTFTKTDQAIGLEIQIVDNVKSKSADIGIREWDL